MSHFQCTSRKNSASWDIKILRHHNFPQWTLYVNWQFISTNVPRTRKRGTRPTIVLAISIMIMLYQGPHCHRNIAAALNCRLFSKWSSYDPPSRCSHNLFDWQRLLYNNDALWILQQRRWFAVKSLKTDSFNWQCLPQNISFCWLSDWIGPCHHH